MSLGCRTEIYLGYSKPLDDTASRYSASDTNPMLGGRSRSTDINGTCKEQQSKVDQVVYRHASYRLGRLPLGSSWLTIPGLLTCHSTKSTYSDNVMS
jgi:hypothetical protein